MTALFSRAILVTLLACGLVLPFAAQAETGGTLSDDLVNCMQEALGDTAVAEISGGEREPTPAEKTAGEACMATYGTTEAAPPAAPDFSPELSACLEAELGTARFAALMSGTAGQPTAAEKAQAESCFEKHGKPAFAGPGSGSGSGNGQGTGMPTGLMNCLRDAMGETVFSEISSGKRQPTQAESQLGQACFEKYKGAIRVEAPGSSSSSTGPVLSSTQQDCIKEIMGDNYDLAAIGLNVSEGTRRLVAEKCFSQTAATYTPAPVSYGNDTNVCMREAFGDDVAKAMQQGTYTAWNSDSVVAGKQKMSECLQRLYGGSSSGAATNPSGYTSPSYTYTPTAPSGNYADCLKKTLGESKYSQHLAGQYNPVTSEWDQIKSCTMASNPVPAPSTSSYTPYTPVSTAPTPPPTYTAPVTPYTPVPVNTDTAMPTPSPTYSYSTSPQTACLQAALGPNYTSYLAGSYTPTPGEQGLIAGCY